MFSLDLPVELLDKNGYHYTPSYSYTEMKIWHNSEIKGNYTVIISYEYQQAQIT